MRILLINHYAGSPDMGMEFRPYYMAKEWVRRGHRVDIIAADFSHLRRKNPKGKKNWQSEKIDGIYYHWIKAGKYSGNGLKRAWTMLHFVGKIWWRAKDIAKIWKPDVVITSSTYPLDTYAGQRIRKFGGGKLIHEIHDMWPISPMELGGMSKYHPFIVMMQLAENSFCRHADKVVSLLPAAKDYLICHGMSAEKFHHISNGIVVSEWEAKRELPKEYAEPLKQWRKEGGFIICFFGSHTKTYALSYLINAIKELDDVRVKAVFVGDGIEKDKLMQQAKGMERQIQFFPPIRKEYIPELLDQVNSLYIGEVDTGILRFGISMNKIFDAMMSGKPILYAVKAPNNYIDDYHCGITVEPENTAALREGIKKIMSMSAKQCEEMGRNGRKAAIQNFTYEVLAEKFLKVMKE